MDADDNRLLIFILIVVVSLAFAKMAGVVFDGISSVLVVAGVTFVIYSFMKPTKKRKK